MSDDEEWGLDSLHPHSGTDASAVPPLRATRRLVTDYRKWWTQGQDEAFSVTTVLSAMCTKLGMQGSFTWEGFDEAHTVEQYKIGRLRHFVQYHGIDDNETQKDLFEVCAVVYNLHDVFKHVTRLIHNMSTDLASMRDLMPPDAMKTLKQDNQNMIVHDESLNTNWQNAFCHLRQVLEGCAYRRADGRFFSRIVLQGNVETLAFKEAITIVRFVAEHTAYDAYFHAWRWITNPTVNQKNMVDYLTNNPLAEAPDLVETRTLRSYGGDAYGRGAGVYDCGSDMFFPYCERPAWVSMANEVQKARRKSLVGQDYVCKSPEATDVCIIHLETSFPYNIFQEVEDVACKALERCWRAADVSEASIKGTDPVIEIEALGELLHVTLPRDAPMAFYGSAGRSWQAVASVPADATRVTTPALVQALRRGVLKFKQSELDALGPLTDASCVDASTPSGLEWTRAASALPSWGVLLEHEGLSRALARSLELSDATWDALGIEDLTASHFVRVYEGGSNCVYCCPAEECKWYMPWARVPMQARATISHAAWVAAIGDRAVKVTPRTMVTYVTDDGDGSEVTRYFAPHTGRTWLDCDAAEIDQIYRCQRFGLADCAMLWGNKGRLFFPLGTFDTYEYAATYVGIGGCGKSTITKAVQAFWPRHLCGVLSSNMQSQFGMSSIAVTENDDARAIAVCPEMSASINLPQEEFQSSQSRESMSLARKFKAPLQLAEWTIPFLMCGNACPGTSGGGEKGPRWRNEQGQVSRRLAGVGMFYPVNPRRGDIVENIKAKQGSFQRKCILAYHALRCKWGVIDPMSVPHKLPPAFEAFYRKARRDTDPVLDFLCEGSYVVKKDGAEMTMTTFKALYDEFRLQHNMGKAVKWGEDVWRTPFNEQSLEVEHHAVYKTTDEWGKDAMLPNVLVIYGLARAEGDAGEL